MKNFFYLIGSLFFITSLNAQEYCTVQVNWGYSYLQRVQLGDINHVSGSEAYSFNPDVTAQMVQGETYPYHITINRNGSGASDNNIFKIWVDWNENYVFDQGEVIYSTSILMGNSDESNLLYESGEITIPENTAPGDYRIRIFNAFDDASGQAAAVDGCGSIDSGEVEDFLITVLESDENAEPVVRFFADRYSGNPGLTVQFFNNSMNSPTSLEWTFEGGEPSSSTEANPIVTYLNDGSFSVQLTAGNANGENELLIDEYIQISSEYCDVTYDYIGYSHINNFITHSFQNESDAGNGANQTDYTDIVLDSYSGAKQKFVVSVNKGAASDDPNILTVWVDWNNNGSFADDGEQVFEKSFNLGEADENGDVQIYGTFDVPEFDTEFSTRMRIINSFDDSSPASTSGCGSIDSGEAEDYTFNVNIDDGSTLPIPFFVADKMTVDAFDYVYVKDLSMLEDEIEWSGEDAFIAFEDDPETFLYFNQPGEKQLTITASNAAGEQSYSMPITVIGNVAVDEEFASEAISVSPNPASGSFRIEADFRIDRIEMYNQIGQLLSKTAVNNNIFIVDAVDLNPGAYLIKVYSENQVFTKKMLIE